MKKVLTGIPGLDEMLEGGIPQGRTCLLLGGPGTGKTLFGLQFLLQGVQEGENGLYVTMEEKPSQIIENATSFNWDLTQPPLSEKISFVDASPLQTISSEITIGDIKIGSGDFSMASLMNFIKENTVKHKPTRMVLDSLTTLIFQYNTVFDRRRALLELFRRLNQMNVTCIITSELLHYGTRREIQIEEYLSQGVIAMTTLPDGTRMVQIKKMRGINHDLNPRPYHISNEGLEVFNKENIIQIDKILY